MKIKPSIQWINTDKDAEFINDTTVVIMGVSGNPDIYDKPVPTMPVVQAALDDFSDALAQTADGGPSATANKNKKRLILAGLVRQLASYVAVACQGDMTNLLLSGFPVQKPVNQPIGPLPTPSNTGLKHGLHSGELAGSVDPVFGALLYTFRLTPNTPGAETIVVQSSAAKCLFTGLTPAVSYSLVVNAIGTAGPSGWSNPAVLVAD
jgi:hypothetical protein